MVALVLTTTSVHAADWTPAEITTALWLDADDAATITTAGAAGVQWRDKSGNGNHVTQATPSRLPTYTSGQYVTFDGSDDYLSIASRLGLAANPDLLIMMAMRPISGSGDRLMATIGNGSHNLMVGMGTEWGWFYAGGNEEYNNVVNGQDYVLSFYRPAGGDFAAAKFYENGTEQAHTAQVNPGVSPANTGEAFFLGINHTLSLPANMRVMEVFITEVNDDTTRQNAEGYLAHKWGLEGNLPADHPHKAAPPSAAPSGSVFIFR